jgi:tetratricopeptide (TPR) repeat protein
MSSSSLEAAFAFASNSDWARAVPAAREALAADPQNAHAHALLALALSNLEQPRDAVEAARRAVALDPELAFAHYVLGHALFDYDDVSGAERAAREALRLDPDAQSYSLLAQVLARRSQWQEALEAAERGLEIDPENTSCANLRALALSHLGRGGEAEAALRETLALDPDDARAHANRGWMLLRQGNPDQALESFRDALRLDPTSDWARSGIVEALKARKGVYRLFLYYSLWMGSLTGRARWMVIIGLFVGARIVRETMRSNPGLMPILGPVLGLYVLFVIGTWISGPLSNLLLRLNPFGRLALSHDEVLASNLIGVCIALTLVSGLLFAVTNTSAWLVTAASSALLLMPIGGAFRGHGTRAWRPLLIGLLVLATFAVAAIGLSFAGSDLAVGALIALVLGAFIYGWTANFLVMKFR